jgi:hypothetical protein
MEHDVPSLAVAIVLSATQGAIPSPAAQPERQGLAA